MALPVAGGMLRSV